MTISDYTSFDDVRAALGVSQDEIKDTTLSLDLFTFNLVSELESIDINLPTDFASLPPSGDPAETVVQKRFRQSVKLFATYAVAKQATTGLPLFAPKEQTDGKAALVRFAQDPYKATIAAVKQQYDQFRTKLEAAYAATKSQDAPATVTRPYMSVVSPSSDPVLGT